MNNMFIFNACRVLYQKLFKSSQLNTVAGLFSRFRGHAHILSLPGIRLTPW